jgi:hypothetical protein
MRHSVGYQDLFAFRVVGDRRRLSESQ